MTLRVLLPLLYIAAGVLMLLMAGVLSSSTTNGGGDGGHRGGETAAFSSLFGTTNELTAAAAAASNDGDDNDNDVAVAGRKMQSSSSSSRDKTDCSKDADRDFVCVTQMFGTGDVLNSCEATINEKACSNCTLCPLGGTTGYQLNCSNIVNKTVGPDQCFDFSSPSSGGVSMMVGASTSTLFVMLATTCSFLVFGGFFVPS